VKGVGCRVEGSGFELEGSGFEFQVQISGLAMVPRPNPPRPVSE